MKVGKLKTERIMTMITVLLFLLMTVLPASAADQPQGAGFEPTTIGSTYHAPYRPIMQSPNATNGLMQSGSRYSSTIVYKDENGTTIVDGTTPPPSGPRKTNGWPDIPFPDPIGDAMIPLAVLACAYLIWRVMRKRKRA